jgi:LysM repeat protein
VKKGETLSGIAAQYKVGVEALKKANKLKSGSVSTGQKLVIP